MNTVCQALFWMLATFVNKADQIPTLVGLTSESSFDDEPNTIHLVGEHNSYHLWEKKIN